MKHEDDFSDRAIFKLNNGNGALLCSKCSVIIKVGHEYTPEEKEAAYGDGYLPPQYCEKCIVHKEGDQCPHCIKLSRNVGEHPAGKLCLVKETFPYDTDHLQCDVCDSTYCLF